jgi:tripartite-type tricarboxylate transporter receptor subunit TctC
MYTVNNGRRAMTAFLAIALTGSMTCTAAQGDKPVRIVVPNAPGSSADALARTVGHQMSAVIGQAAVIENLPGAGGSIGAAQVVRAPKDGRTLGIVSNNHVINPSIYKSLPFDSIKDITPIMIIASTPMVLVAHPSVPAKDLKELIALAKAKPGELGYGSSGNGTILHLAGEALQYEAGIKLRHIPYRGTGQQTADLLGGQIQLAFLGMTGAMPHIKAGKLKAIGLSSTTPSALLPGVTSLAQQGLPDYDLHGWIALIGPAGLASEKVAQIHTDVKAALESREAREALAAQGFAAWLSSPEQTLKIFREEMERYAKLVKQSGMAIE